jgi:type VI secretion system secreted protein Hcp
MAYQARMQVTGKKTGKYPGEGIQQSASQNWIPVLAFHMGLQSPRDIATGQASGKRQWETIVCTKEWGGTSPLALNSLVTNEILTTVVIEFTKTKDDGTEYTYHTITLTNATLSNIKRYTDDPDDEDNTSSRHQGATDTMEVEDWSFTFQQIQVDHADGNTTFMDNWVATL